MHRAPPSTGAVAGARTVEEWISLVRVLVLIALIPSLWFGIIPIAHPALNAIIVLLGGYVILLAVGHRWSAALVNPDRVIALDLLVTTLVVTISGGTTSPFVYVYYLTILEAAARLNVRQALAASLAMAAMIILLAIRAGHAASLETAGFRLGALIAGGFFLALVLGMLLQEYRAAQARMQGLQFANTLAIRLSGELRVEGVLDILLQTFQETTRLDRCAAFVTAEDGTQRLAATRGFAWGEDGLSPDTFPLPALPDDAQGGEVIIQPYPLGDARTSAALVCVPLVRAGRPRAWLCGVGTVPTSGSDALQRLLQGVAAQGTSALEAAWLHQKVLELAATDVLTGLANRRSFMDRLTSELADCRRTGRPLSLALVDLDDFKAINDTYGHSVGDNAVIQFSDNLRRSIRGSDLAARFGGDEFAMLFPATSRDVVENILRRLETTPIAIAEGCDGDLCLRFSWGIATWPQDGETPEPLLQVADRRLYAMKRGLPGSELTPSA